MKKLKNNSLKTIAFLKENKILSSKLRIKKEVKASSNRLKNKPTSPSENISNANEKLMATVLQTLPVAVFAKDVKNNFTFCLWNKKAEIIYGTKAKDVIGKTDYDFFPKKEANVFRKRDLEFCKNENSKENIGEEVWTQNRLLVLTKNTLVRDDKGEPLYLIGVSEDITKRKKAESNLRESEEKYRSLVENSPIIIMTTDATERITFINFTVGHSLDNVIGKSVYNFVPAEHAHTIKHYHALVFKTKTIQTYEVESLDAKGKKTWYQSHVGPIIVGDKVQGLTIFTRDISNRKNIEEKISNSLKEKEVLLKEVHHRVKNNLQIIHSILNLQKSKITDKKTIDILGDSQDRIKSMSIIHELLYQSKDFSRINFSNYVSKIATNLVHTYSKTNNVDLILNIAPVFLDLDLSIPCGLVVNELITNAMKYAFIDSKKGKLKIGLKQSGSTVKLTISDNGKGIPKTVNYKNTQSLGMQLVMALIEQIEGKITLNNSKGASYIITIKNNSPSKN